MIWKTICRVVLLFLLLPALSFGEEVEKKHENDSKTEPPQERSGLSGLLDLGVLEKMIKKIEQVEILKKNIEYVCPDGAVYDEMPEDGRCSDGSLAQGRVVFKKVPVYRPESMQGQMEEAITEAENKRVAVFGSARGIIQQAIGDGLESSFFPEGSFDLTFLSRPSDNTTFFIDLEAISGTGPDDIVGSFSRLNTDAETVPAEPVAQVREAWLSADFVRLTTTLGKVSFRYYFDRNRVANDETTQFLNTALVNNPLLRQPPNGAGFVLQYNTGGNMELLFGIQNPDPSVNNTNKVYAAAEIDYRSSFYGEENWRLWGRTRPAVSRTDKITNITTRTPKSTGIGISLDQEITHRLVVFVRVGQEEVEGATEKAKSFSAGGAYTPGADWMTNDRIGFAVTRQNEIGRSEDLAEIYYSRLVTERLLVAADLQWLAEGTNSITNKENKDLLVPGVRVTIYF